MSSNSSDWHHPRRLIGPDQIKALRDLAKSHTGEYRAFDQCVVQTVSDNRISADIEVDKMRVSKDSNDFTYGQLINYAVTEAERLRKRLDALPADTRLLRLDSLLREARRDGRMSWVLSAACLRKLIFPRSYDGTRTDNVFYFHRPQDGACGKQIALSGLTTNNVHRFLSYAARMAGTVPTETITPITRS